jgi:hypothetical protein
LKTIRVNYSYILLISIALAEILLFQGCANQKPPGGGEEDKTPPKLLSVYPLNNSLNFSGKSFNLEFDEYVDRRSLQEAFHISPPYKGEISFEWSGKEAEIVFETPLWKSEPNKTFVVTINSNLSDIRGNKLSSPISFAFSTGGKIDMASVSGKVFNNDEKPVSIMAYKLTGIDSEFNPSKNLADYITETSTDGSYNLTNLSPGEYKIIAIEDEDRNLFYTTDRENYAVLSGDFYINDSAQIKNVDFFLRKINKADEYGFNLSDFFKDSLGIVSSSVENDSRNVLPDQSLFFYFTKSIPTREDFVKSFSMKDEAGNFKKTVFNWRNDSLVEIITAERMDFAKDHIVSFQTNLAKDSVYNYVLKFKTVSSNSFGEVNGFIRNLSGDKYKDLPVIVNLTSIDLKPEVKYSFTENDTVFSLKGIYEAGYSLFSFIDKNVNGTYDYGNPYPFEFSEPFYVYPQIISAKGGWAIENVIINFSK